MFMQQRDSAALREDLWVGRRRPLRTTLLPPTVTTRHPWNFPPCQGAWMCAALLVCPVASSAQTGWVPCRGELAPRSCYPQQSWPPRAQPDTQDPLPHGEVSLTSHLCWQGSVAWGSLGCPWGLCAG